MRSKELKYHLPNFMSKVARCVHDKEKERMGCTKAYYPFALWIERSQMTSFQMKLLDYNEGLVCSYSIALCY